MKYLEVYLRQFYVHYLSLINRKMILQLTVTKLMCSELGAERNQVTNNVYDTLFLFNCLYVVLTNYSSN